MFDASKPDPARVYDYLIRGAASFAADRELADGLLQACPALGGAALENCRFLGTAVTWVAGQGVTQFADLGVGHPVRRSVQEIHEAVRAVNPAARVAYVDSDEVVLSHSSLRRGAIGGVAVADADLMDPAAVLAHPDLLEVIDPARPVCLVFGLVLNLSPAGEACKVIAGYADLIAPGSFIVVTCGRVEDAGQWEQLSGAFTAAPVFNHTRGEIAGFLDGLELVPPGIVATQHWRPGWGNAPVAPPGPVYVLGGIARKAVREWPGGQPGAPD